MPRAGPPAKKLLSLYRTLLISVEKLIYKTATIQNQHVRLELSREQNIIGDRTNSTVRTSISTNGRDPVQKEGSDHHQTECFPRKGDIKYSSTLSLHPDEHSTTTAEETGAGGGTCEAIELLELEVD